MVAEREIRRSKNHLDAVVEPTQRDVDWTAGFLEGEGWFAVSSGVAAKQKNREPLERLQKTWGGRIVVYETINEWRVSGFRARRVMRAVFTQMSVRRQSQILACLNKVLRYGCDSKGVKKGWVTRRGRAEF